MMKTFAWAVALVLLAGTPLLAGDDDEDLGQLVRDLREEVRTLRERIDVLEGRDGVSEVLGHQDAGIEEAMNAIAGPNVYAPGALKLVVSGQVRAQFEDQIDYAFGGARSSSNDFVRLRTRLNFDAEIEEELRAFVQIQDSRFFGVEGSTLGNIGGVDLKQGFVDFTDPFGLSDTTIRVGRQGLNYGDQRLISTLDWSEIGRSWDGVTVMIHGEDVETHVFITRIDENFLTTGLSENEEFFGIYNTMQVGEGREADAYVLFRRNQDADDIFAEDGDGGHESLWTLGGRYKAKSAGFDYVVEAAYQLGDHAGDDIRAWMVEAALGYTFADADWTPRVGVAWTYATGDDDPTDGDRETFNPLYPFGHFYLGYMDRVGRQNLSSPEINLDLRPKKGWLLSLDYHLFRLVTSRDALYSAGGVPIRMATTSADDSLGSEIDLHMKVKVSENVTLWGGYSHFFAGKYLDDTGEDDDADFVFLQLTVNF